MIATRWAAIAVALALAGCGGGGGGGGGIGGTGNPVVPLSGTLRLSLTDAPACGYDAVFVTIDRIRVHQGASAADGDGGWSEIVLNPARRIDLLTLTGGKVETLGQTDLPAGRYTQLRLLLAANDAEHPLANAVVPTGGGEAALATPSAQQSGIKLDVAIDVRASTLADYVLDFDACRSVVARGNSGQYNLNPVISVEPLAPR